MKGNVAAIVLIVVGVVALGANLDLFHVNLFELIGTWWPLIPIGVGISMLLTRERS
ncbi:hypothetical protein DFR40_1073 [Azonexus fungiphilus]|uniref:LiaI-LiaF-like transmembrane region domain-containing protein n=1 Tax=Azonexus fungiphilus TaxID=146940 RepID=A0A495WJW7_9RHOO|nr:DUF5668 domain-containing protein [Azonexus fungiphilus]RKT60923.1 hypothetical protein DFR40_1073 [Azonexus fungiphilus]